MAASPLLYQFKMANVAVKVIVINVAVFILLNLIPSLFGQGAYFTDWLALPSSFPKYFLRPWTLISYAFVHGGFWHILFNMYFLYIFSRFSLNLFAGKRFLTIYLLGGMAGGLLYMISFNVFPTLIAGGPGYMVGASAAVNAIIVFIATYTPNTQLKLFMFTIKLWHIAAFVVLSDLLRVATAADNTGGMIAHLGGAAFGYIYAQQLAKGNDIGAWFERLMDTVASWFSSKPRPKKSRMRTVHRTPKSKAKTKAKSAKVNKSEKQQQIDAILDKISKSGYDSLSKAEKDFLFKAGKDD
jgi:membrane associated rhomboid family serine protease